VRHAVSRTKESPDKPGGWCQLALGFVWLKSG